MSGPSHWLVLCAVVRWWQWLESSVRANYQLAATRSEASQGRIVAEPPTDASPQIFAPEPVLTARVLIYNLHGGNVGVLPGAGGARPPHTGSSQ